MMNETKINWTELTWNPASGCKKVPNPNGGPSECDHCYADELAEVKRGTRAFPNGFDLTLRPHKLAEPQRAKRPSLIFTSSMTDIFFLPQDYRERVFDVIESTPHHRYQILTKRPEKAAAHARRRPLPRNVWLGVTVGVQDTASRIDALRGIDAAVRFISAEPLLSELHVDLTGIHWVIGGGESGRHLSDPEILAARGLVRRGERGERRWVPREDRIGWARSLRDACAEAGAAFWWKQWGGPRPESGGRTLDGREHDGMPTHVAGAMPAGYVHEERNAYGRKREHEQLHLDVLPS